MDAEARYLAYRQVMALESIAGLLYYLEFGLLVGCMFCIAYFLIAKGEQ